MSSISKAVKWQSGKTRGTSSTWVPRLRRKTSASGGRPRLQLRQQVKRPLFLKFHAWHRAPCWCCRSPQTVFGMFVQITSMCGPFKEFYAIKG